MVFTRTFLWVCAVVSLSLTTGCSLRQSGSDGGDAEQLVVLTTPQPDSSPAEARVVTDGRQKRAEAARYSTVPRGLMHNSRSNWPGLDRQAEQYRDYGENKVVRVVEQPVSTFSIDVDTGAYSNLRRFLNLGQLPPTNAVRIEELLNYFDYDYPVPQSEDEPFSVSHEIAPSPLNPGHHLLRIGLQGYETSERLPANLVFLVDVSGSMRAPQKLGLVQASLKLLSRSLTEKDVVSVVTYAGNTTVVLEGVAGNDRSRLMPAIDGLMAGGGTAGRQGLQTAYQLADQYYIEDGINRVILATDGDFNIGISGVDELKAMIGQYRRGGIALTALGYGMGNYNDPMLEQLADVGNGNHAYIDNLNEARKVLIEESASTLQTIASDVKLQIEFNPALVAEYRLIGYENRMLDRADFNNDRVDAGELGAGHSVTAFYEIRLAGSGQNLVEPLRYQDEPPPANDQIAEIAYLRLRYKLPGESDSQLISWPIRTADITDTLVAASGDFKFAVAVVGLGERLRQSSGSALDFADIKTLARQGRGKDEYGYRSEFFGLIDLAELMAEPIPARQ